MEAVKRALRTMGLRRATLAAVRMSGERSVLARLPRRPSSRRARILCYHSVGTPQWGVNDVTPARFRRQLELALAAGYAFRPAEEIVRTGGQPNELALTFDDGLLSVATNAAPVLAELGLPWSLFVVSDWAEGRHTFADGLLLSWRDIEQVAAAGATVGSHSVSHANFRRLSADLMQYELGESRRVIQARTGIVPTAFAIPFGQSSDWPTTASDAAQVAGYQAVYAQSEGLRPPGTVPRTFITRFDDDRIFRAALDGAFDAWEEWS